jgi:rare lipoprotein A
MKIFKFIIIGCISFFSLSTLPSYERSRIQKFTIKDEEGNVFYGIASYYGPRFHGKRTASGKIFNKNTLVAAHLTLPFGTKLLVTNVENQKSVIVEIIDRGPYIEGRMLDLSEGAANSIGLKLSLVRIEIL